MNEIEVGTIVKISQCGAYCYRADGSGSSWELVKGTLWYVAQVAGTGLGKIYQLDDRTRFANNKLAFEATVGPYYVESAHPLEQLAEQAGGIHDA